MSIFTGHTALQEPQSVEATAFRGNRPNVGKPAVQDCLDDATA